MLEEENNKTENNLEEENNQTDNDLENDKINQDSTTEDDLKQDEKEPTPEELIIELNTQIEELKDQRLRSIAELENYRKRSEKDQADALKYGIANFAKEVVSIRDNIERANASIVDELKKEEKIKPVIEGLDLIQQSIISVLDRFGIKKIEAMDQKFDHNLHQAMIEIERDDCEPGIVVQELIPGYTLHDRLLRPSMVGVSKIKTDKTEDKSS
ncbi:nucleotide exchange factor GrpE [Alphaproteobacteria bacterium]|nr:nucleotide exchange factor GrpE [Alphaproteobacteria bacterium]MDB9824577.1 nucleotide exchange factor GrpE [Alphaproteobacteria bacterium]